MDLSTYIAGLIGVVLGGALGFFSTRWQTNRSARVASDAALRERRLGAYSQLWQLTGAFPKNPEGEQLEPAKIANLLQELNGWYFSIGGLVLSNDARQAYFLLIETLRGVRRTLLSSTAQCGGMYVSAYAAASDLRAALAADVGSRRRTEDYHE